MINNALSQAIVAAPVPIPGDEGIQFDEEEGSLEEQRLETIKRKILEKLTIRLGGQPLHRAYGDRPFDC